MKESSRENGTDGTGGQDTSHGATFAPLLYPFLHTVRLSETLLHPKSETDCRPGHPTGFSTQGEMHIPDPHSLPSVHQAEGKEGREDFFFFFF